MAPSSRTTDRRYGGSDLEGGEVFERFTDGTRRTLVLAQEEVVGLRHRRLGCEHLLLGVLASSEGAGAAALDELGVELPRLRSAVEQAAPPGLVAPASHIPFAPAAKMALEQSLREALQHGAEAIDTGHLLLALLHHRERPEDVVSVVLAAVGVDPRQLVAAVERHLEALPALGYMPVDQLTRIEAMLGDVLERLDRIEARLPPAP